jgi:dihydroneopterin aldolase
MKNDEFEICIKELEIYAIIGLLEEERDKKQRVLVDFSCTYTKQNSDFIDYSDIAKYIESTIITEKFYLLEDGLTHILDTLTHKYKTIKLATLKITKPEIIKNCRVSCSKSIEV